jgi:hypothetical protein
VKRGAEVILALRPEAGRGIATDNLEAKVLGVLGAYR